MHKAPPPHSHHFLIAGTGSGSGKTTITLALIAAFKERGLRVQAFKCGPDYIDTSLHRAASARPTINLDRWMMGDEGVRNSFNRWSEDADISIVEGVMGLFDGLEITSDFGSSADMATFLNLPIVLVVQAKGMARSFAALVQGFCEFKKTTIIGVIANGVGSAYHASLLQKTLEEAGLPPLCGYMQRDDRLRIPERHLGLVPAAEGAQDQDFFAMLSEKARLGIDVDALLMRTQTATSSFSNTYTKNTPPQEKKIRIALAYDKAFHFYYEDNIELLRRRGIEIIYFSPLADTSIPDSCDMLYFGGGFPELYAAELSQNRSMLESVKEFSVNNGYIYAECGGMMYLSSEIRTLDGNTYTMCNIFSFATIMNTHLKKLGYREVTLNQDCFLGKTGDVLRGHEFHYSSICSERGEITEDNIYTVSHPVKGPVETCGYKQRNTIASYIHLHWLSYKSWAPFFSALPLQK